MQGQGPGLAAPAVQRVGRRRGQHGRAYGIDMAHDVQALADMRAIGLLQYGHGLFPDQPQRRVGIALQNDRQVYRQALEPEDHPGAGAKRAVFVDVELHARGTFTGGQTAGPHAARLRVQTSRAGAGMGRAACAREQRGVGRFGRCLMGLIWVRALPASWPIDVLDSTQAGVAGEQRDSSIRQIS
ncbi:hypothetical protein D3C71_1428950 [compost metagenome]